MKKLLTIVKLIAIIFPFCCYSQINHFNISGRIIDSDHQAIPYATIVLDIFAKDTIMMGAITNDAGLFSIRNVPRERFRITVSFIGYSSFIRELDLPAESHHLDLDTIVLQSNFTELQEVVVKGERTGLRSLVDKDVFIPDAQSIKTSTTGLDLLSKIPGVRVRPRDLEISVEGSNNVLILINGASSDRNINAINPRHIERIEVIKNPTAAYESDILAVLNIILKPDIEKGFHIASSLEYSFVNLQNNFNAQIEYNFDKLRVFAGYNLNAFKERNVIETRNRHDFLGDVINQYYSISPENLMKTNSHRFQYGTDYRINDKNILSFTGNMLLNDFEDFQLTHSQSLQNNNVIYSSNTQDNTFYDAKQHNYNLFYNLKLKPRQELKLNSNLFLMNRTRNDEYINRTFHLQEMALEHTIRREKTINEMRSINIKVDYSQPIHENIVWNMGYQLFRRKIHNDFFDSDNAISLEYRDYRNSFYGDFTHRKGNISLRAGVRMEHLTINISDTLSSRDLHPLPLGSVMYSINQSNNVGFTYNRRLRYPSFQMLIPFDYYSGDAAFVSSGNPKLDVEKQHNFSLRHTYRKNDLFISTSFYHQRSDDIFGMVRTMENGVLRSVWENIDWENKIGLRISGNASFFDFIEFDADINIFQSYFSSSQYNGLSYYSFFGLECHLPFDLSLGVDFTSGFSESRIDMHIYESPFIERISLTKEILEGKGNIGLSLINPTAVKFNMKSWDNTYEDISKLRYKTPVYLLKFTYFFSSGKRGQRVQREQIMQEEQIK
ncbi:TonB-dependent receptor [Alkalitalea saponilacus]|uniref:Outer membrane receptor proteins, mostly Fe transport n=1 Tax=Alkalitalea saponilacus TaxID=889453 RepID=A0A1T5HSE1_9BACT|nr:TonB-dependent receptor [Alkalitalea saponilacus]ASB50044.1 TonB-dependent receptor [Alkalitalea saponilacus]SKC23440.1 Outer membrane receptor proteins, mostly Fe transport [Alkalitalea saponilacus]